MPDPEAAPRPLHRANGDQPIAAFVSLSEAPRLALDTETDAFHRYREKICLLQISSDREDLIYDPLQGGLSEPMRALLAGRSFVLHDAVNDVLALRRDYDIVLPKIFDTSLAARLLGLQTLGLQALLAAELGVALEKGPQRSDWAKRPLSPAQLEYARRDTMFLLPLADRLAERLVELGREAWLEEECEAVRARVPEPKLVDLSAWSKLKGAKALSEKGQRVLAAAFAWREEIAEKRDRAPFRVLPNEVLLNVAFAFDRDGAVAIEKLEQGARAPGIPRGFDARGLVRAIRSGLDRPPPRPMSAPGHRRPTPNPAADAVRQKWVAIRTEAAAKLGLDPALLLPAKQLERLVEARPSADAAPPEGISHWRWQVLAPMWAKAMK